MLVGHERSHKLGVLMALRPAPGGNGLALAHSGLQLASRAGMEASVITRACAHARAHTHTHTHTQTRTHTGSEASTIMSARRCPLFLQLISYAIDIANRALRRQHPHDKVID